MPSHKFLGVPVGSKLHWWVRVEPPGCAVLRLDVMENGTFNPPTFRISGVPAPPPLTTQAIANLSPEMYFGPFPANYALNARMQITFVQAGVVTVVSTLEEPGGGAQTRPEITVTGKPQQAESISVSVRT